MMENYIPGSGHDAFTDGTFPYPPCEPTGNYICVIFSRPDSDKALPVIRKYNENGYRVWYDTTASSDTLWTGTTRDAIACCTAAVLVHNSQQFYWEYYWKCYSYAMLLEKKRLVLHFEPFRQGSTARTENEYNEWIGEEETGSEDFGEKIDRAFLRKDDGDVPAGPAGRYRYDLAAGFSSWDRPFMNDIIINLRTHEMWSSDQSPIGTVTCRELSHIFEGQSLSYKLLPASFTADYCISDEDRAFDREQAEQYRETEQSAAAEKPRKEQEQKQEEPEYRGCVFPEGYPYMDEFEYLDSLYD